MKLKKDLLEKEIQKQILDYLWAIGAYAGKTKTMGIMRGNRFCYDKYLFVGFPDITCFYSGNLYFIEVKKKGKYQTPEQLKFEKHCFNARIKYILAHNLDDVIKEII